MNIKDRIKVSTTTVGTGSLTLGAAYPGFQSFVDGQTYYCITSGNDWEVGVGTCSAGILTRDSILDSSNGGSKISLTGVSIVFCTYPANKSVYLSPIANPQVGQSLVYTTDGWNSSSSLYGGASGIKLINNTFVTDGTGYLSRLVTSPRMIISNTLNTPSFDNSLGFIAIGRNLLTNSTLSNVDASIFMGASTANNTSGSAYESIFLGYQAGRNSYDANQSIHIGSDAGNNSSGGLNIYIGNRAGEFANGTNNLVVKPTRFYNNFVTIGTNSNKVNIHDLFVGDSISRRASVGNNDSSSLSPNATLQVLSNTSSKGLLVKAGSIPSDNIFEIQDSIGTIQLSVDNQFSLNVNRLFTNIGTNALINTPISSLDSYFATSVSIGGNPAGPTSNAVAIGVGSIINSSGISTTVAIGRFAGRALLNSSNMHLLGFQAGQNSSGCSNIIAIGSNACNRVNNSHHLFTIGSQCGIFSSSVSGSIYLGRSAGQYSYGNNNLYIGELAGSYASGNNNVEIIGSYAFGAVSSGNYSDKINIQRTIMGDSSLKRLAVGNVGLNELTPNATLAIYPLDTSTDIFSIKNTAGTSVLNVDGAGALWMIGTQPLVNTNKLYNTSGVLTWYGNPVAQYSQSTKTADYTVQNTDNLVVVNSGNVTLPNISTMLGYYGKRFDIKCLATGCLVSSVSLIDGAPSIYLFNKDSLSVTPYSGGWLIMNRYSTYIDGNL